MLKCYLLSCPLMRARTRCSVRRGIHLNSLTAFRTCRVRGVETGADDTDPPGVAAENGINRTLGLSERRAE